jgi:spoIIIJ-associated protein
MSDEVSVEATGETVGEAKWAAVRELQRRAPGVDREAIRFQVVDEGERGLLGVGTTPARVVASAPAPATPAALPTVDGDGDLTSESQIAGELLRRTCAALGLPGDVHVFEQQAPREGAQAEVVASASGPDAGVLIGRHGQMLDALQLLANAIAHARIGEDRRRIVIDAAGYRARRTETLEALARRTAERVSATGRPTMLEPMSAVERRIVHEALKDDPEVETASEGAEPYRCVVVLPRVAVM